MNLKMTPTVVILGGLSILAFIVCTAVYWPSAIKAEHPSELFRSRTDPQEQGRLRYIANGCTYCPTQSIPRVAWCMSSE